MNVLVVAAHPDDEVLGAAGTMARLADEGHEVAVLILGEGATSRAATRAEGSAAEVDALASHSRTAAAELGVTDVEHAGLPDNRFDHVDLLDVVKVVEGAIGRTRPTLVFTQHGGDVNIDHKVTFAAVMAATRPVPGSGVRSVLAFEVGSSTEWAFGTFAPVFHPTVFYDITATLDRKLAAMAAYPDEVRPFPHPRSAESLVAQARRWGSTIGVEAAEAFQLVRELR